MRGPLWRLIPDTHEAGSGARRKEERVRRRTLLAGAALVAVPLLMMRAGAPREAALAFAEIPGLPGFRFLDGGSVSAPLRDPFAGLRAPGDPPQPEPLARDELCAALFGPEPLPPGTVPVASFSDYYCPYCRDLTVRLAARADPALRLTWHELPLLGDASEAAARAALAADLQGAYAAFQARLLRATFQPTDAYLADLAVSLGLDRAAPPCRCARRGRRPPPRRLCPRGGDAWHRCHPGSRRRTHARPQAPSPTTASTPSSPSSARKGLHPADPRMR
jgi:hypothetical protein